MSEPSKPVIDHIKRWLLAMRRVEDARSGLNAAQCELSNAVTALGKFMCPPDAAAGEQFNFWINGEVVGLAKGDQLLTVKRLDEGIQDYEVKWREKARKQGVA